MLAGIEISSDESKVVSLVIMDIEGKKVMQKAVQVQIGFNSLDFNTATLGAGSYLLQIHCTGGCKMMTRKFVKY